MLTDDEKDAVMALIQTEMGRPEWSKHPDEVRECLESVLEKFTPSLTDNGQN